MHAWHANMYISAFHIRWNTHTCIGMLSTFSLLWANLGRKSNCPNVAYLYEFGNWTVENVTDGSGGCKGLLMLMGKPLPVVSVIYSAHFSVLSHGLCVEEYQQNLPLFLFASPTAFWLTNAFFSSYVNILKQILANCPGSYLLRWLCICLVFYGSNADGSLISFILNFLGDTSCYYLTCNVFFVCVGKNVGRP